MGRDSVFISYSHHDREWLDRLNVHLRPLVRDKALVVWDDTKLSPGSLWRTEIEVALAGTKVAVLLVSADFLASDFVARSEIPLLLAAARDDGAVILPLIVSASRFSHTPALAQFQSVNDPSKPLIGVSRSEQEEILVRLTEAVERAICNQQTIVADADPEMRVKQIPLIRRLPLKQCLERLRCQTELLTKEDEFIRGWLSRRVTEGLWRSEEPDVDDYLKEIGEPKQVAEDVGRFIQHLVACSAPTHSRVSSTYVSTRKVLNAYRLLQQEIDAWQPGRPVDSPTDKLLLIHKHLLKTDRLTFLPARLLLDGGIPATDDEACYFEGRFTLDVDLREIAKVPGAAEIAVARNSSMYGVVSNVFQSSDPFVYPLLRFVGHLGPIPVTMILSRKYIRFSSMTATSLVGALSGRPLEIEGIGTIRIIGGVQEVHPLACSIYCWTD